MKSSEAAGRRILCYGDSNTFGFDPRSYLGGRYPESLRWTGRLRSAGWEVFNEGENGRSVPQRDWQVQALAQTLDRTETGLVTVMLGSNDLLQGADLGTCEARMESFLTALLRERPLRILLTAPPPMVPGAWVRDPEVLRRSRELAPRWESLAGRLGISFADAGRWKVQLSFDGVHFSPEGHAAFAAGMEAALEDLLKIG